MSLPILPKDILVLIQNEYLEFEDANRLSSTCKRLRVYYCNHLSRRKRTFDEKVKPYFSIEEFDTFLNNNFIIDYSVLTDVFDICILIDAAYCEIDAAYHDTDAVYSMKDVFETFLPWFYYCKITTLEGIRNCWMPSTHDHYISHFFKNNSKERTYSNRKCLVKDVELVVAQVNTTTGIALYTLIKNRGDVVNAIIELQF
jgi:hypothetical protein